ncbi:MAG: hypothetical protein A2Z65_13570 [Gallionellales bacterium RIFCSPLOWO2_02_58_13]|nr:MAG: hypothetical protein A2Z65_13570 [Gallionellales bacterium RIFCSPLOWO2_02_58_13]
MRTLYVNWLESSSVMVVCVLPLDIFKMLELFYKCTAAMLLPRELARCIQSTFGKGQKNETEQQNAYRKAAALTNKNAKSTALYKRMQRVFCM